MDGEKPIPKQGLSRKGIKIGENVWIGAGARIGAGAVLTKSTRTKGVYAGKLAG